MLTKIGLDTTEAAKGLKELTTAVNTSNSAWKAQEAQLKNAGDYVGAAKAKYEGLEATVKAQQEKLAQLKRYQSECNQTTKEGTEAYNKYQNDINKATTRLASFTAQQDRAREAVNLQNTGILKLNQELKNAQTVTTSYVKMLQEQGQKSKAAAEESKGLQSQLSKMNTLYSKQVAELDRVKSASGENSTQYAQQAKRVNDLGTDIAKTTNRIKELDTELNKKTPGFLSGVKEKLMSVNSEANKTSKVGETIKGVFGGSLLTAGVISLTSHIQEIGKSGYESAEAAVELGEKWKNIGVNDKGVQQMAASAKDLKENTNLSGIAVGNMLTKFYGITGSVKGAEQLSKGVGSLTDKLKLSQQSSDAFANGLTKIESAGTVTSSSLGRLEKQAPGLTVAMQQASGMTRKSFDSLLSSGKMTSDQFNTILEKASKDYSKNSDEFNHSSAGAMKHLQQSWADTKQALMKPLVTVAASGLSTLNKALDNPATHKAVTQLGQGIANLSTKLAALVSYISSHMGAISTITSSLFKIVSIFGQTIWKTISGIIKSIGSEFGNFGVSAKAAKDPLNVLAGAMKSLASNKALIEGLAKAFMALFVGSKITSGILTMTRGIVTLTTSIKAIKTAQAVGDLTKLKGATKGFAAIKIGANWVGDKAVATSKSAINGVSKAAGAIKNITVKVITKAAELALTGFRKALTLTTKGFKLLKLAMVSNPFGAIVVAITAVVAALVLLYKHSKTFRNFVNGLAKAAEKAVKSIVKFFKDLPKNLKKIFDGLGKTFDGLGKSISKAVNWKTISKDWSKGWSELSKETSKGVKQTSKDWNGVKSSVSKATSSLWKSAKNDFKNGWSDIGKDTSNGVKTASKDWNNLKIQTGKFAADMMKNNQKTFSQGYKVMQDESKVWHDITSGNWGNLGSDTKKWASDMTKFWKSIFSSTYDWLNKLTGGRLGDMLSTFQSILSKISKAWNETWSSVKSFFSGIWDGIKSAASAGIRGVVNVINGGINGIDKVISFFGGKATAISPIKLAAGTMNGRLTKDTIAVLNDGHDSPETGNREMVEKKDGRRYLVHGTNTLSYLEAGDAVYNASQTRKMMANALPHFGLGTMFGNIVEAVEGTVGDVSKWFGDKIEAVEKFVKDPVAQVTSVFDKSIGSLSGASEFTKDFAKPSGHFLVKQGKDWFTKLFKSLEGSLDNPGGTGVERWRSVITAVAERMKVDLSSAGMNAVLHRIAQESNGSPTVTNNWDSNAKAGHPSTGLLQYIQPTFDHWLPKGFTNDIHNGSSQIAAMFNDSNWLRDISVKGGWGPTGHKKMAKGGIISQNQMIEIAENNKPEMVIPIDASEKSRANQLLAETNKLVNPTSNDDVTTMATKLSDTETQLRILNEKFDTLLQMFNALLGGQNAQTKAIKASGTTPLQFYKKQSNDQSVSDYQAI